MKKLFLVVLSLLIVYPLGAAPVQKNNIKIKSYKIDVAIKRFWGQKNGVETSNYKQSLVLENGKKVEFSFPDKSHVVELFISEDLPRGIESHSTKKLLYYEMKIFETKDGQKRLLSSPEIIAHLGQEANISSVDDTNKGFEVSLNSTLKK